MDPVKFILAGFAILLVTTSINGTGKGSNSTTAQTMYGINYETDESWLVYQTVAPIIYKYQTPSTYKEFMNQIFIKYSKQCSLPSSARRHYQGWCTLMSTLKQLGAYFESSLSLKQIFSATQSEQPYFVDFNCQRITKTFPSLQTDAAILEDYLSNLKSCTGALYFEEIGIQDRNGSDIPSFSSILGTVQDSYFQAVGPATTPRETFINSEVIPSTLGFLIYFAETQKWKDAISDCRAGIIPSSLVQKTQLQGTLNKLQELLRDKFDQNLVIGQSDSEIDVYYNQKLADCTFSGSNFIVRILVPVKSATQQLLEVMSLPFLSSNAPPQICYVSQFKRETNLVHDFTSGSVIESDCVDKSKLCYSPLLSYSNYFYNQNACAKAMLSYPVHNESFEAACTVACEPTSGITLPLVRKLGRNLYHILGEYPKEFEVVLDSASKSANSSVFDTQVEESPENNGKNSTIVKYAQFGAIQVTIPCNSRLVIEKADGYKLTFFALNPCGAEMEIDNVQLHQLA